MNHTDALYLIHQYRAGDYAALEALLREHQAALYRLAVSMLDDPTEADEALQDAFVAAVRRLDTYRGESSFGTWLYAITLNVCRSRLRKHRARERLLQAVQTFLHMNGQPEPHPEDAVIQHEADAALWQAIQKLDDRHREVVILRYYHELRLKDIAQIAGVSERAVRDRLHAAHERMRTQLKGKVD